MREPIPSCVDCGCDLAPEEVAAFASGCASCGKVYYQTSLHPLCGFTIENGAPPFDWVIEHAPTGDWRAAVQRFWDTCPFDLLMRIMLRNADVDHDAIRCAARAHSPSCAGCADAIRARYPEFPWAGIA